MNVLIVEDVILVAERIADLTKKYFPKANIELVFTLDGAREFILDKSIDLVFLDLNVNGENGYDLLEFAAASSFETVVITASAEKAALAFDYGVLDFITKPIIEKRFELAAKRYLDDEYVQREKLKFLSIKLRGEVKLISLNEIEYIKADGNYSSIFTNDQNNYLHDKSSEKLLQMLPKYFLRIHRSYIVPKVNISSVLKLGGGRYRLKLVSGQELPLSRQIYKRLFS